MKLTGRIFPTCRFGFRWVFIFERIPTDEPLSRSRFQTVEMKQRKAYYKVEAE